MINMGDIKCRMCGEPWDYYGLKHGDVELDEGERILNGEGCPCCSFGKDKGKCGNHDIEYVGSLMDNSEGDEVDTSDWALT